MRDLQGLATAIAYLFFTAAAAEAGTFTYDATVNLNPNIPCTCASGFVVGTADLSQEMFLVGVGDQIAGTITIANGPVDLSGPAGSFFDIAIQFDAFGNNIFDFTSGCFYAGDWRDRLASPQRIHWGS
jgi:hypothetical protein